MNHKLNNKLSLFLGATLCCFLWGSAFPFVKMGYQYFNISPHSYASQILFAGMRFALAGILAIAIGSIMSKKILVPGCKSWKMIAILAFFQTFLQYIFFYIGLAHTTGVKASVIDASSAFIAILIASLIFRQEKLTKRKLFACGIGFLGVVIANLNSGFLSVNMKGDFLILLSAFAYAVSSVLIKIYSARENPVLLSGWQFFMGGTAMILSGLMMGGEINTISLNGILCLLWLAVVSAVAYSIWGILLKHNSVSQVTVYSFLIPVFGVLLSALLVGETSQAFGVHIVTALILVSAGIILTHTAQGKK